MKKYYRDFISIGLFLLMVGIFFYQTLAFGKLPIPSDALVGLYHPWRDFYAETNPRGIPFKNFLTTDPVRQQIPWRKIAIEQWRQGEIPRWNPYSFSGMPLAANIQAGAFYPLNILFFVFSFPVAWTILIVLEPALAGIFLYIFLRHLGFRPVVGLLGAIAWSFSGFAISWLTWGTMMHVALWLPLLLLATDKIFEEKTRRMFWFIILVFSLISQFLAGHAQVSLYILFIFFGYICWRLKEKKLFSKRWPWFVAALLVFVVATFFQWIPLVNLLKESSRFIDVSAWQKAGWFLPWQHLVQFFAPDFFGNPTTLNYWGIWNYGEFIGYIGIIPLFFSFLGLFANSKAAYWKLLFFIALLFMLPTPLAAIPYQLQLPLFSSLQPTRLMVVVDFSLIMLAAFGMNQWLENKNRKTWFITGVFIVTFLILWIVILSRNLFTSEELRTGLLVAKRNLFLPSAIGFIGVFILIISHIFAKTEKIRIVCVAGLVGITAFDLLRFGWKFTPFTPLSYFFPNTKAIAFLEKQQQPFRVMNEDNRIFPPNVLAFYNIESIEGYDPIYLSRYEEFIAASERGGDSTPPFGFNRIITPHNVDSPILPLLNVGFITSLKDLDKPYLTKVFQEGETRIYAYTRGLPRAYLAENIKVISEKQKIISALFDPPFNSQKTAIVENEINVPFYPASNEDKVTIVSYKASSMTLDVHLSHPRFLVVSNILYPGWMATIDGKQAALYQTNYVFMGLVVPEGEHSVIIKR